MITKKQANNTKEGIFFKGEELKGRYIGASCLQDGTYLQVDHGSDGARYYALKDLFMSYDEWRL